MEKLIIRKVKQSDAKDLWENIFSRNTPAEVEERIAGNIRKMDSGEVMNWVAEVDGVVIGNILLVRENHDLKMHRCSLGDVVVNPVFRGMGIAQKLFDECKIHAKDNGLKIITVNCRGNTPAETVYKNLGFIEAGRIPNGFLENWGDNNCFDDVFFYLPL